MFQSAWAKGDIPHNINAFGVLVLAVLRCACPVRDGEQGCETTDDYPEPVDAVLFGDEISFGDGDDDLGESFTTEPTAQLEESVCGVRGFRTRSGGGVVGGGCPGFDDAHRLLVAVPEVGEGCERDRVRARVECCLTVSAFEMVAEIPGDTGRAGSPAEHVDLGRGGVREPTDAALFDHGLESCWFVTDPVEEQLADLAGESDTSGAGDEVYGFMTAFPVERRVFHDHETIPERTSQRLPLRGGDGFRHPVEMVHGVHGCGGDEFEVRSGELVELVDDDDLCGSEQRLGEYRGNDVVDRMVRRVETFDSGSVMFQQAMLELSCADGIVAEERSEDHG